MLLSFLATIPFMIEKQEEEGKSEFDKTICKFSLGGFAVLQKSHSSHRCCCALILWNKVVADTSESLCRFYVNRVDVCVSTEL